MSDAGRKDFSTKAKEEATPDSAKSTQQKVKETVTDYTDKFARGTQSDESKGSTQEAYDKGQRMHENQSESVGDKVKNALGMGGENK